MSKRYRIVAKRKNTDDPWTDWTSVNEYQKAIGHAAHVEEVGYMGKMIPSEEVTAIWDILKSYDMDENMKTELTDKILDAGFGLVNKRICALLSDIKKAVHKKGEYSGFEENAFIKLKVFDVVLSHIWKYHTRRDDD